MYSGRKPYVHVTLEGPEDGGDFGPNTPGTRTSGFQEALDYAHENHRDVYVYGGRGGMHDGEEVGANVYTLEETLRVPFSQDFRFDGGNYLLSYTKSTGDAVVIDSQMNCRYKFGLIVSNSDGAAVRIRPESSGPDDFVVTTVSTFDFAAICSPGGLGTARGAGLVIDSSYGPILNNRITADETNTQVIGVHLTDAGGAGNLIAHNTIDIKYNQQYHAPSGPCTNLRVGDPGSSMIVHNKIDMSLHAPIGAHFDEAEGRFVIPDDFTPPEDAIGADIFAQRNLLTLACYGKRADGKDIVFEPDSQENTVFVMNLPSGITNLADVPTNRIVPNGPVGFRVPTPPVPPSGADLVNTTPHTVQVMILSGGDVADWTLTDSGAIAETYPATLAIAENLKRPGPRRAGQIAPSSQTITGGLAAGQTIILEPGEKVRFSYSLAPEWRWKALR